jgi:hypothetical protein
VLPETRKIGKPEIDHLTRASALCATAGGERSLLHSEPFRKKFADPCCGRMPRNPVDARLDSGSPEFGVRGSVVVPPGQVHWLPAGRAVWPVRVRPHGGYENVNSADRGGRSGAWNAAKRDQHGVTAGSLASGRHGEANCRSGPDTQAGGIDYPSPNALDGTRDSDAW